ncbi:hypothetical protein NDU88_005756 [Pleurodeles waltl]|uniref:Uncharacterized protein n=1 Tax=Pleurodeles waltl TaxID=8319 RepID=A0AAV7LM27_PLEWA|nr:hypothetical protein NDU88_005756 [Pleurodeles waltl]
MQVFTQYFERLYADPVGLDVAAAQAYFSDITLVWFDDAHRSFLDVPFSVEEVIAAIHGLPGVCGIFGDWDFPGLAPGGLDCHDPQTGEGSGQLRFVPPTLHD